MVQESMISSPSILSLVALLHSWRDFWVSEDRDRIFQVREVTFRQTPYTPSKHPADKSVASFRSMGMTSGNVAGLAALLVSQEMFGWLKIVHHQCSCPNFGSRTQIFITW